MSLIKKSKEVNAKYKSDLEMILDFASTTEKSLTRKLKRKPKAKLAEDDKKDLDRLLEFLKISTGSSKKTGSISIDSKVIGNLIMSKVVPMKHKNFLTDMTLSYLISYQEAMLKDYLYAILISHKSSLKSSSKITYSEALSFKSIKTLVAYLAQKEVDGLGYGSIDDVAKYFNDKFNIEFTKFNDWEFIVEASYRRNLIIHNKGISNGKYCKRTGYQKIGKSLNPDIDYIVKISKYLIKFSDFCFQSFKEKFKLV